MGRRPLALVLVALLCVAACTSDVGSAGADPPAATPASAAPPDTASPTSTAPPPPQQAALTAYQRYTAGSVDALTSDTADVTDLEAVAADQALSHLRNRLRANARDGVGVTGDLTPSATIADVRFDGERAVVTDCVLNGLAHVDANDPDRVVSEATGWRQPVVATVEQRDGQWLVTRIRVPLRDGSGRVPPPPDDPPYLRGPAQGPAPPSCVPPDLAEAAIAAYEAFHDAYDEALGLGRMGPANPDSRAIADAAVDPQLSAARDFLTTLAKRGQAVRGEGSERDPWAVSALEFDDKVVIYDCVTVGSNGVAAAESPKPLETNSDAGTSRLDGGDVVRTDGELKVSGWSVIEEGLEECTSPQA